MILRKSALVFGAVLLVACGDDGTDGSGGGGGNAGGSTATGGANSGGNTTGGTGNTGTGGNLSQVDPPTALPGLNCESRQANYQGTIGGSALSETLDLTGSAAGAFRMHGHSKGFVSIGIPMPTDASNPAENVAGALRFPDESSRAGQVWCIDDGLRSKEGNDFSYIGHLLGTCPGTGTADTVYMCRDAGTGVCDHQGAAEVRDLGGTLGGVAIPPGGAAISASARVWTASITGYGSVIFADTALSNGASQPVTGAIVGLPNGHDPGAVYCVSGTWSQTDVSVHRATLDTVSYLGNCNDAPPTDTLEGCLGY